MILSAIKNLIEILIAITASLPQMYKIMYKQKILFLF